VATFEVKPRGRDHSIQQVQRRSCRADTLSRRIGRCRSRLLARSTPRLSGQASGLRLTAMYTIAKRFAFSASHVIGGLPAKKMGLAVQPNDP
jgi:hypothetical protein